METSNGDELKARRQSDLEKLELIPEIHATMKYMNDTITRIENNTCDYPVTKTNVTMLMKWHWIIVTAVSGSIVGLLIMVAFKR